MFFIAQRKKTALDIFLWWCYDSANYKSNKGYTMVDLGLAVGVAIAKRKQLKQDVASRAGVPNATITSLLNGSRDTKFSTLVKVAAALDMELSELIALGE